MDTPPTDLRRMVLLGGPPALLLTMLLAFRGFTHWLGPVRGYLAGFVLYWAVWCLAVPFAVLSREGVTSLWRRSRTAPGTPRWVGVAAIGLPLTLGYGYAFPHAIGTATPAAIVTSAVLAAINAPLEELLWRGCYRVVFGSSTWLALVYPNIWFGLWHLAPLSVMPNRSPGGSWSFVAVSSVVGLLWGLVVLRTGSLRVTSLVHAAFDFSGLGGRIYFA